MTTTGSTRLLLATALVVVVAACTGGAAQPSAPPSAQPSAAPSAQPSAAPSAQPSAAPATGEAAAAAVRTVAPLFDGLGPRDKTLIGQGSYWEATSSADVWTLTFTVGWGDCQAGCIDTHAWTYAVGKDGIPKFVSEIGSVLTDAVIAGLTGASKATGVAGRVGAGPTCPVERPGDPSCAPRMVAGSVLVVQDGAGKDVATFTTNASGLFRMALAPGDYTLVPGPVEGLMGQAKPEPFTVSQGAEVFLPVAYDTGIR